MVKDINYIYLHSVEHSGSTLVACLLGAHPSVSTVGEFTIDFSQEGKCSCGSPYTECQLWQMWKSKSIENEIDFRIGNLEINLQPKHNNDRFEDLFYYHFNSKLFDQMKRFLFKKTKYYKSVEKKIDKYLMLSQQLCEIDNTSIFLDTSKNPYQASFMAQHPKIKIKLISLVRDGRAVMNSLIEKEKYTPIHAINAWKWGNRNIERIKKNYFESENIFELKLEDLCHHPEEIKKQLFEFIGVNYVDSIDYTDKKNRHIVGNYMRHKFDGTIRKTDSVWKTQLSKANLSLFEAEAGKMNKRYGY